MKVRDLVVLLLCVTVVAPILLYTDRVAFKPSSSSREFLEELPAFARGGDSRRLNVIPQETSTTRKEPVGVLYSDESASSFLDDKTSDKSTRAFSAANEGGADQTTEQIPIKLLTGLNEGASDEDGAQDGGQSRHLPEKASQKVGLSTDVQSTQISGEVYQKDASDRNPGIQNEGTVIPDARLRHLKDQLIRARVYLFLPSIKNNPPVTKELRQRIKEVSRAISEASKDSDLPKNALDKLKVMEETLTKAKQIQDDCDVMVKKLRAMLHSSEEQVRVHKKQALFLTQLTAKTLPKGLHCLPLRLTTEYYTLNFSQQDFPDQEKLEDPLLFHYALFSDNVLATAAVVNSTVSNAKHPSKHVFHIVTDRLNYAAMRMWFLANPPGKATIQVQNIEELTWLNSSYSPVLKQLHSPAMIDYYFRAHKGNTDPNMKYRNPKYLSILNHLRFYLPQIFPKLHKVLFLDDDIVVQKDLSGLWSLDLKGNVNGAVETCGENFHRFDRYLNFSNPIISKNFDPHACGWAYGMNIFDLAEWRRQNITEVYHGWQKLNHHRQLWKLGTLPPGLITFWRRTHPLNPYWHVLGLGYNPGVTHKDIERAAVIHYNGNLKPWLEISIPKYRSFWSKYVDYENKYLRECNISP